MNTEDSETKQHGQRCNETEEVLQQVRLEVTYKTDIRSKLGPMMETYQQCPSGSMKGSRRDALTYRVDFVIGRRF